MMFSCKEFFLSDALSRKFPLSHYITPHSPQIHKFYPSLQILFLLNFIPHKLITFSPQIKSLRKFNPISNNRCSHFFLSPFITIFPRPTTRATRLHSACRQNNAPIVKLLADKGADIAVCLPCSTTPLLTVCRHGLSKEVLDMLCLAGADVNARDAAGMCALQVVAREGHASLAKRLLEAPDIDVEISCTDLG